jgi:signal transduction histidine kinase
MQYLIYVSLAPVAALAILAALFYAWQRRGTPGAPALIAYLGSVTGFLVVNLLELLAPTEAGTLFLAKFNYIFIVALPVTWLAFTLQYTGRTRWLQPGRFWIFCIEPVLTLVMALTTEQHGLIWSAYRFQAEAGFLAIQVEHGPWFWLHVLYALGLLLAGSFLAARAYFNARGIYSHQSAWVVIGVLAPLSANVVYLFDLIPGLTKDFTPIAFALSGLAFTRGIYKYQLLNLMPVARYALVDTLPEGLLVLDRSLRVVDLNDSARELLGIGKEEAPLGRPAGELWPAVANWSTDPGAWPEVVTIRRGARRWACALHVSNLTDEEVGQRGWLVVLSDVTRLVDAEEALEQANQALGESNAALRRLNEDLEARIAARTRALSQRAEELEALARVSVALRKAAGLEELLDILLVETVAVLEAASGGIFLMEDEELLFTAGHRLPIRPGARLAPCRDPLWQVVETGQASYLTLDHFNPAETSALCQRLVQGGSGLAIAPIRAGNRILGLLFLVYDRRLENFTSEPARLLAAIAEIAGNALQRVRSVENLEALVQSRTRDLSALYEVTATTNLPLDLSDLLQRVLATVLDVLGPRAALLHMNEDDNLALEIEDPEALNGQLEPYLFGPPPEDSASGSALFLVAYAGLDSHQVSILPSSTDPEAPWQQVLEQGNIVVQPQLPITIQAGDHHLVACVGVPVRAKGRVQGVLSVLDETLGHLSAEDIALLAAIADHVGGAVERSRLRRRAEQAAVIEERQRLARDLHDSVTQTLYSLVLFAEAGKDALQAGNMERTGSHLVRLRDTAQQALKEMRLLIYELRPLALQSEGLVGALRHRLETVEQRAGIEAHLEVETLAPLPERVEAGLYGIAQEALNNVLKHARATQVTVRLSAGTQSVDLEIIDNGRGFPGGDRLEGGIGLTSMRERARALGGTVSIRSETGRGASVLVTIRQEEYR